ncbi:MAG TPA: DUF805 domain-containing protein [Micromonosporaceae bacterium]
MGSYVTPWKKYATFSGRARRSEYWTFVIVNWVIAAVLVGIGTGAKVSALAYVAYVFLLAALIPTLAVLVRRLHDSGRSGGWFFISFVPFIGGLWLLVLMFLGGTQGANRYGEDPRTAAA